MRTNHVKAKLQRGEASPGVWLNLASVNVARLLARSGFDWLTVDIEHSALSPETMAAMIAAIVDAGTSAPLVRLPNNNAVEWYKWALDAGAWGVIVPMVNTREEAERAVSWSKYPPAGTRSLGGVFAPYGLGTDNRSEYAAAANSELMVIVQIESPAAIENLDQILSVPGLDAAFVGPNDLHALLGLTPSSEGAEPEFVAALQSLKEAARRYNLPLGMFCSNGAAAARRIAEGFQMVSIGTDAGFLLASTTLNLHQAAGK